MLDQQLAEELHKPIITKFSKSKVYSSFTDNTWGTDLTDRKLTSNFNKEIRFLFCFFDIFSECIWIFPLKNEICITITIVFQKNIR